jgi:FKBP-type peptidyl-prolyl cis-trans isomerase
MMQIGLFIAVLTLAVIAALGQSPSKKAAAPKNPPAPARPNTTAPTKVTGEPVKTPTGLEYWEVKLGTGAEAAVGQSVTVNYTGWLASGKKFDSSVDARRPFSFKLGSGEVIKGWDQGVAGMKVGGKRQLRIPPDLAYGDRGYPDVIPPGSTLVFDVELLRVE